nr:hypothetical protein Iba_scaffold11110CG0010 [Ipomoea batatas]
MELAQRLTGDGAQTATSPVSMKSGHLSFPACLPPSSASARRRTASTAHQRTQDDRGHEDIRMSKNTGEETRDTIDENKLENAKPRTERAADARVRLASSRSLEAERSRNREVSTGRASGRASSRAFARQI